MTAASKSTRENISSSGEFSNNDMLFLFYLVKVQTKPDICSCHAMCSKSYVQTVQLNELFGQFLNVPSIRKKVTFLVKYSQSFPGSKRMIFYESLVKYIRRKMELFARRKTSSENAIFELSSGLCFVSNIFSPFLAHSSLLLSSFTLTCVPARCGTQLWSVLLRLP
jgi:hypothetical protein